MLKFYYDPKYKYTNRTIIDVTSDSSYTTHDYENIDSPDTINGHIIYTLDAAESIPTYIVDTESGWRWFVSGITQLRTGKFQISLLRDIISENPILWSNEEAYISAGTAQDYNRFKRWNLPYTNTKIEEQRLNINGSSSFFVYYVNEQDISSNVLTESDLQIESSSFPGITGYDYVVDDLTEIPNYNLVGAGGLWHWTNEYASLAITAFIPPGSAKYYGSYSYNLSNGDNLIGNILGKTTNNIGVFLNTSYGDIEQNRNNCKNDLYTVLKNFVAARKNYWSMNHNINDIQYNSLEDYVDKIIYNRTTNKIYKINKSIQRTGHSGEFTSSNSDAATLLSAMRNINFPQASTAQETIQSHCTSNGIFVSCGGQVDVCTYTLEEIGTATSFNFNFKANTRKLPKSAVRCVNIVPDPNFDKDTIAQALMLAQTNGINADSTTGRILDIQYLPFSIATSTNSNIKINSTDLIAQFLDFDDYSYITDLPDLTNINKETDTIKIVSPSRASQFLFRPYDNNGNMLFETKITLKPYASVIYIRPSTQGLLIRDWNDKDCLIIQEDFSLTNVSSEWTNYIYNNKNYSNIFEREMQGREYERSWERRVEQAQAKSDEWSARNVSAQKASTYTGNLPIVSSIASAIGTAWKDTNYMEAAQLDREYNEALYQQGMSLSRDLFEYQLENIKSQPLIPSKITTIDCKFLDGVYLEFYSTNETELEAISNFYKYNGNRIDSYGTFSMYWGNFVRGKIIIAQNYTQPEIDELNRRLSMGIFTGGI